MRGTCSTHGRDAKLIHNFGRKPEGNRACERFRRRLEDNIRMELREIWSEVVDWNHLVQERDQWWTVVKTAMNIRVP